jgi:transcriptional regulator with XRE-family HTH domain
MATFREQVVTEIRVLLARRGMSVAELARQLGVSQKYLANRIPQRAGTPVVYALDTDDLARIADALDVSVASLIPSDTAPDAPAGSPAAPATEGRVLRFKPDDAGRNSTYKSSTPKEPLITGRSAEITHPPSGPSSPVATRSPGPASRRPRVSARLVGSRP